jgi:CO dehydrogenase nickel-insertion accessory protein CooC1
MNHAENIGADYLGVLPYETKIQEFNIVGRPVVELPRQVGIYRRIQEILEKLGVVTALQKR